ncbi:MAG: DUF4190 domain-containing protein [Acidobacteriota bacterium]|nr:DUF4190 domain-containing protein [Acidobacteriota bacterium]
MKRCPTCNQEFTDEWLTFCTQDGTSLVEVQTSPYEPPPTIAYPAMPPSVSPSEEPTLDLPGAYKPPQAQIGAQQPLQVGWRPPPPPAYSTAPQQSLAIASLVLGVVTMTVGWCCYFGVLTGPIAVALGIYALVQIKNDPTRYSGKGLAIGGIVSGGLYFVFIALIILIYGLSFLAGGLR